MGTTSLATLFRRTGLTVAGLLVAAGMLATPAAAASPDSPSTAGSSSSAAPSSSTAASTATTDTVAPAATAPPEPTDPGPPCTTNSTARYPVICLPAGSGEDTTASLTPGTDIEFDAQVVNGAPTTVTGATVVITLPQGLALEPDEDDPVYRIDNWYQDDSDDSDDDGDGTDLACTGTGSATITCGVGTLAPGANILIGIDLEVADDVTPGTTLAFHVALNPAGTQSAQSTSVDASVQVLAASHLEVSLTPSDLHVVVGHHATMTGIVHNAGPGAAPSTFGIALAYGKKDPTKTHFSITNGMSIADLGDGTTTVVVAGTATSPLRAQLQRRASARSAAVVRRGAGPSLRYWPLGTVASGATTTVSIQLKALSAGTDDLVFGAFSAVDGLDCAAFGGDSGSSGSSSSAASGSAAASSGSAAGTPVAIQAAAAASTTAAAENCSFLVQTHITAIPVPAALADTGDQQLAGELGFAAAAVVLGGLLTWIGRRRVVLVPQHR